MQLNTDKGKGEK